MVKNLQRIGLSGLSGLLSLMVSGYRLPMLANNQPQACPSDLGVLMTQLLDDIPGYANRVIQRSHRRDRSVNLTSYVIVAGKPEFEPLTLKNSQDLPFDPTTAEQVFFTTLERQYSSDKAVDLQNFYWLFLAETKSGWRMVLLYSQLASLDKEDPPLPPIDNTDGVMGQAIRLWLRDCRAGAIQFSQAVE